MKYKDIVGHLKELEDFLNSNEGVKVEIEEIVDPNNMPLIGDKTDQSRLHPIHNHGEWSKKSGIYIFLEENENILYIGKAGENNLRRRIWDHIDTPEPSSQEGWIIFPKNDFDKDVVREGKVNIGIFKVNPVKYSSLAEVYLQTIELPKYCKRIG